MNDKELRQLVRDLIQCIDELMPGAAHVAGIDFMHLNDTLIAARMEASIDD